MRKLFLSLWIFLLSISGFPIQSIGNTNGKDSTRQHHINMTVSSREKEQKLEGMVLDEEGYAIGEVVLEAKQNGKVRTVQSDKYGKFQFSIDSGLLSIFAQKEGFLAGGEIILVQEGRPIRNLQIVLKKRYSHILGIVTDGVKALSGVTVRLRNENLETIDQVFSDALGYYQFRNIGDNQKVAVSVYEEGFQEYISDFFLVDKNYEKEHIILRKKEKNML
ncbi:carboxypeptidase [Fusobacterium necrophorum subsp. funduliforme]